MKKYTYIIIKTILNIFFPGLSSVTNKNLGCTFKWVTSMVKHNGTLFTVKYIKECRLHVTRYMCGKPLMVSHLKISLKDGFPIRFWFLKELIDSGKVMNTKYSLTILNLSKCLWPRKGEEIPVDLTTITKAPTSDWLPSTDVIARVINLMNLQDPKSSFDRSRLKIITKAGPDGPQLMSWPVTIKKFTAQIWFSLFMIEDSNFSEWLKVIMKGGLSQLVKDAKHSFARKLSVVKDPECKMRVIAIFDYISQTALQPLHDDIFHILKNIEEDRTFSQDPKFHVEIDKTQHLWSLDLSAATDRFPIQFQTKVLSLLRGENFAMAWKGIMVSAAFKHPEDDSELFYRTGQPMGAKSSWAVFALCHHIIIRYCAYIVGQPHFKNYIVLGDDVVINNDLVAEKYRDVMNLMGVEISVSKTHVSKNTYEFAKRWINTEKGEITPVPIRGLVENISNKFICFNILFDYFFTKGNGYYADSSFIVSLSKLYHLLSKKTSIGNRKISINALVGILSPYNFILRYNLGLTTYDEIRNYFALYTAKQDEYPLPNRQVVRSEIERILSIAVIGVAWNSLNRTRGMFDEVSKLPHLFHEGEALPLFDSIYSNINSIAELAMSFNPRKIDLNKAVDALIQLDINSITSWDRQKVVGFKMFGTIAQNFRKEMRFDANQISPPARSMTVMKAAKDLQVALDRFRKNQAVPGN